LLREYIGIPFKHLGRYKDGVDCYGLITLIYKEKLGIYLFDVENYRKEWYKEYNLFVSNYWRQWRKIDQTELLPYDVLLFCMEESKAIPSHVGLYIGDGRFIHCMEKGSVIISKFERVWKKVFHSAYRFIKEDK